MGSTQGSSTAPLRFGNVADGAFNPSGGVAVVADGDGGVNNRVVALDATQADLDAPAALLWVAGNAPPPATKKVGALPSRNLAPKPWALRPAPYPKNPEPVSPSHAAPKPPPRL